MDGATMELIEPWVKEGKLPNLGRMMKSGVWAELLSTMPYITTTAWSSFATGLNPGKHGIFDFYQHVPKTFDVYFTNSGVRCGRTLWDRVGEQGKKVCVINVPMTYPPEKVNGVLVSGMDAPGTAARFTHPERIYRDLKEALGEYIIDFHFDEIQKGATPGLRDYALFFEKLAEMTENRLKATEYLMEKNPWDLLVTVFVGPDRIQHQLWKYMDPSHPQHDRREAEQLGDAILKVYRKCDEALGRLLDRIDDDTSVLIMSDHGAGPSHRVFYVRSWLEANGYLARKDSAESTLNLRKGAVSAAKSLFAIGKKFIPKRIKKRLKSRLGRDKYIAMRLYFDVDWQETTAYSEGVCGNIFVNLKGREPHGIVEPGEEYERVRGDIIAKLMEVKDPETGKKIVKQVHRKEELYSGPFLDNAPDLLVEGYPEYHCRGDSFMKESSAGNEAFFCDAPMSGSHKINGAFLALGPHFKRGYCLSDAEIIDIAPTVLYLLGMDIPETIDGKVLTEGLDEDYVRRNPIRKSKEDEVDGGMSGKDVYSAHEKELIEERLRGLGYLE